MVSGYLASSSLLLFSSRLSPQPNTFLSNFVGPRGTDVPEACCYLLPVSVKLNSIECGYTYTVDMFQSRSVISFCDLLTHPLFLVRGREKCMWSGYEK